LKSILLVATAAAPVVLAQQQAYAQCKLKTSFSGKWYP
jgi:hypothetical protein